MDRKVFRGELKQVDDAGSFEAVIATLGVVDHDLDVVEPGALAGKVAAIVPAHQQHTIPLGKVRVEERGDLVVAVGKLNLEIAAAKEWHSALKYDLANPPAVQEWSWGYRPTKHRFEERDGADVRVLEAVDLIEVSPVLRGASMGTRTLAAKGDQRLKLVEQIQEAVKVCEAATARFREARKLRQSENREMSKEASAAILEMAASLADVKRATEEAVELARQIVPSDEVSKAVAKWAAAEARLSGA